MSIFQAGLFAVLLFIAGCASSPTAIHTLNDIGDVQTLRRVALALVNEERNSHGLPPLTASAALNAAAQAHAEDMALREYYGHLSPERRDVAYRFRDNGGGLWYIIAENIARCQACQPDINQLRDFQARWMRSPGHERNILDPRIRNFGFGMASAGGWVYAVQTFVTEREERSL